MRKHEADKLMMMIEKIFGLKVVMGGDARIWPIKNALSADGFQKGTFFHILRSNWLIAWKTRAFLPILRRAELDASQTERKDGCTTVVYFGLIETKATLVCCSNYGCAQFLWHHDNSSVRSYKSLAAICCCMQTKNQFWLRQQMAWRTHLAKIGLYKGGQSEPHYAHFFRLETFPNYNYYRLL